MLPLAYLCTLRWFTNSENQLPSAVVVSPMLADSNWIFTASFSLYEMLEQELLYLIIPHHLEVTAWQSRLHFPLSTLVKNLKMANKVTLDMMS